MKKVSVVILNWNGVGMLQKFLPKVVEYSVNQGVEICVADNASTDESVSYLQANFPNVRLILLDKNYGIMTRVGLHCAPSAHKTLGTYPTGTIRFSFGYFNTEEEVLFAVKALEELLWS